jgi:hypothetical protein
MTDAIFYRDMNLGEEQAVCDLVKQVFDEYVASDYGQDGIDEYRGWYYIHPNGTGPCRPKCLISGSRTFAFAHWDAATASPFMQVISVYRQ